VRIRSDLTVPPWISAPSGTARSAACQQAASAASQHSDVNVLVHVGRLLMAEDEPGTAEEVFLSAANDDDDDYTVLTRSLPSHVEALEFLEREGVCLAGGDDGLGRRCPPPGPNPQESPGNRRHR